MAKEIERKFLVVDESWRAGVVRRQRFEQGYLAITPECAVRVRIAEDQATLNIKNATLDIERLEYEYAIPLSDARELMASLCAGRCLSKVRHWVAHDDEMWEVDVFGARNQGLVVAEIEIRHREQHFSVPDWVGREVSGDPRYLNSYLAVTPYDSWNDH